MGDVVMFDRHCPLFREIQSRGAIKFSDVLRLRRDYFAEGVTQESEAQALLALNTMCPIQDTAWGELLLETIGDYIVQVAEPRGYITSGNARWLISHVSVAGRIDRLSCLELAIRVLETARWAPPSLSAFVLRQIELAIVTGNGPLRTAATTGRGRVGKAEVALIRRVLSAGGRGGNKALTKQEAEVLLDIHDATLTSDNCLEWTELVTKALANLLLTASGYAAPPREKALEPEDGLDPATPAADFLRRMTSHGFRMVVRSYGQRSVEEAALARLEHERIEIITAEPIPPLDPDWLASRIGHPAELAAPTQALLAFLGKQEQPLHPALAPLLSRAA